MRATLWNGRLEAATTTQYHTSARCKPVSKARVLVADDYVPFRGILVQFINAQADLICCADIGSIYEVQPLVKRHKPDLLVLGLQLKDGAVLALLKSFSLQFAYLPVLVVSQDPQEADPLYAERVWHAGAQGCVMRHEGAEEMLAGMRAGLKGEFYVSRAVSVLVLRSLLESKPHARNAGVEELTGRELQVLNLLGSGKSTRHIAPELNLSFKTFETHRETLKHKLGLRDAVNLLRFATIWVEGQALNRKPLRLANRRHSSDSDHRVFEGPGISKCISQQKISAPP